MWTKIENQGVGKRPVTVPRIVRGKKGPAYLAAPRHTFRGCDRVTFMSDGNGKLAVSFDPKGDFRVMDNNSKGTVCKVTLPSSISKGIPPGTTEIPETYEAGMLVVDLAALRASADA